MAGREADVRRSIFITGAASGMGRETARLFAGKGWFVGAYDLNEAGLQDLQHELGAENCLIRRLDVTDRADFRAALDDFGPAAGGRLDILFNNAGIGRGGPFDQQPFEEILAVVQVNFIGVLNGIYEAVPLLKATPGSLCFTTSSSSATFGMPGIAVYSATKHAVKGLTEALSVEFKALGIRVADVLPGLIDTPILPPGAVDAAPKEGMFRAIPPVEVAKVVWEAYHTDKLHWYVPEEIAELDRSATLTPEAVRDQLATGSLFFTETPPKP
ncbi:SDR family oxidoreductase [Phenylobacterium sp. J426]|uniref:SDR family oxidoreductase n=1 Tax=Phenylobacterium sp. J426 TaxID=2898439 RepID=UPI002150A1D7|nr:SDR family oxidoreductase [Phenylobacterium sp. J426]MCR5875551.1 SDR family oxidoreductase [Phenylobacterium sp. J426]